MSFSTQFSILHMLQLIEDLLLRCCAIRIIVLEDLRFRIGKLSSSRGNFLGIAVVSVFIWWWVLEQADVDLISLVGLLGCQRFTGLL